MTIDNGIPCAGGEKLVLVPYRRTIGSPGVTSSYPAAGANFKSGGLEAPISPRAQLVPYGS